jgi:hypothetical protein
LDVPCASPSEEGGVFLIEAFIRSSNVSTSLGLLSSHTVPDCEPSLPPAVVGAGVGVGLGVDVGRGVRVGRFACCPLLAATLVGALVGAGAVAVAAGLGVAEGAAVAVLVGVAVGDGWPAHPTSTQDGTITATHVRTSKVTDSTEGGVRRASRVRFIGLFLLQEWARAYRRSGHLSSTVQADQPFSA